MPTIGIPNSATYAQTLSGIEEMLSVLPDNQANEIAARDVRDVVYTLYDDIIGLSNSLSQFNISYTNANPTTADLGGILQGSSFSNVSIQSMFDQLLYPYVAPETTFSVSNPSPAVIEFGNSSQLVSLNWRIDAGKFNISTALISRPNNSPVVEPVNTPLSFESASATLPGGIPTLNTTTTFTFSVNDGQQTITKTANVSWSSRKYYGSIDLATLTGIPTLNLTTTPLTLFPGVSASVNSVIDNAAILGLQFSNLSSSPALAETNITTLNNTFMIFAWPTNVSNINFFVGAGSQLPDTAFTKVKSSWGLTNSFNYNTNYDVWISNIAFPQATKIRITVG